MGQNKRHLSGYCTDISPELQRNVIVKLY